MDTGTHPDQQIQGSVQIQDTVFDAVFASVPEELQRTYPDGWDQDQLNELHDAIQQRIADMAADPNATANEDPATEEPPLVAPIAAQEPAGGAPTADGSSPPTPLHQAGPAPTPDPTPLSQRGAELQPNPDWDSTPQAPTQSARWDSRGIGDSSRYLNVSVKNQMLTSRDVQGKPVNVLIDYIKGRVALGKTLGDPFFAVEQTIETLLHPQVLSFYNTWARIKDPRAKMINSVGLISIDKWIEQFDFRAQMEAEAVGGDQANQLATLVLRTIFELTKQSPQAMFADASVMFRHQIQPIAKGITTDTLMGAFIFLLE